MCCCRERSGITYRVPWEVVEAFKRNEKYTPRDYSGLTCAELFSVIEENMGMRDDNELSTDTAIMRLQQLLENNKHLILRCCRQNGYGRRLLGRLAFCGRNIKTEKSVFCIALFPKISYL